MVHLMLPDGEVIEGENWPDDPAWGVTPGKFYRISRVNDDNTDTTERSWSIGFPDANGRVEVNHYLPERKVGYGYIEAK